MSTAAAPVDAATPATGRALVGRAVRRQRRRVSGFVALLVLWQLGESLVPVVIGLTIDRGVATGDGTAFLLWAAALAGLFVVLSYAYRFGSRIGMRAIQTETHDLRMEIVGHALDPRGLRSDRGAGETLSLATSDAEEVGLALRMVGYAVASLAAVVVTAVVLLRIDVVLGLVVLCGVPLCLAATQVATPLVSRRSRQHQERVARSAGVAVDLVRGIRVLHGIGGEQAAVDRYRTVSRTAQLAGVQVAWARAALVGLAQVLGGVFLAVITLLAGRLALQGDITVGQLIAIVGLTQFLTEPITWLAEMSAQLASAVASGQRIADFLSIPPVQASRAGEASAPPPGSRLEVDGLRHATLDGLDLASPPGEVLGIVTASAGDAQALVRVLAGQVPPAEPAGEVRLGGVPVTRLDVDTRRQVLVVAPHRADLLEGTLRDNVDPWQCCTPERLDEVLTASAVDDVTALRDGGLDAVVTTDGTTYSGGQRQRVALARALAVDPPVLVLHDPTTAVDSVTETRIARGLRQVRGREGRTTWVLTSSPALLEQADRVVVVRDGRVVAEGDHRTLLHDAAYCELVLR
jgi:putative ABC transport system ATP-binding protein